MVTTRNQARQQAARAPCSLPRQKEDKIMRDPQEDDYPLTPRSLNSALPVKTHTASKAPFSHPVEIPAETSPRSMSCDDPAAFMIAAVPAAEAAAEAGVVAGCQIAQRGIAVLATAAQPQRRLQPSEKLLKPLPDKPVECTKLPDGPEPAAVEIEYVPREQLQPVDGNAADALAAALSDMASSEWSRALEALNVLRRLAAHHAALCEPSLPAAVPLILKSVRNLRSALCKTAVMTATDFYISFNGAMLPHTDVGGAAQPAGSLLAQLLLKAASNDKKFVIEEAQRALNTIAGALPPSELLPMLAPYTEHKNPKVRGKAAGVVAAAVTSLTPAEMAACGLPPLLKTAGRLVTDNTPEARDAAKRLAACIKAAISDAQVERQMSIEVPLAPPPAEGEEPTRQLTKWEYFCLTTLGPSGMGPVLRAVE